MRRSANRKLWKGFAFPVVSALSVTLIRLIMVPAAFYFAHQLAVPARFIKIIGNQHGVDHARYPKAKRKDTAQYKCTDAPGG